MTTQQQSVTWSSRWTFILATTGSSVGLGNIWKFPYITGENGGGAFVLVYLACIFMVGMPILIGEVLLGRRSRMAPINSVRKLTKEAGMSRGWVCIGWQGVISSILIMSFYSVIAGWALYYMVNSATGELAQISAEQSGIVFNNLLADVDLLMIYHTLFMLMTVGVVAAGVIRGVGLAIQIMMPIFFVMLIGLLLYATVTGEFLQSVSFLFKPDFSALSGGAILEALGHAFYTLSLGVGAILIYGAYMPKTARVGTTMLTVVILDTVVALVAGLLIFSVVFANPSIEPSSGPGLLFVSLPIAFGSMPGGVIFGTMFFVLITLAAWSSAISLIEPSIASLAESGKVNRVTAACLCGLFAWVLGLASLFSFNIWQDITIFGFTCFEFLDFLTTNIMLPAAGLFVALFVGWKMKKSAIREELKEESDLVFNTWHNILKYITPILVSIVTIAGLWHAIN